MAIQIERVAGGELYEDSPATREFTFSGGGLVYQVVVSGVKAPLFGSESQKMAGAVLACLITGRWPCKFERVEPF